MKQIFKYLAEHKGAVVMIILLLVVQAYCDLSLPSYTSDIVDVGIEQGGIEHEAMEEMRKESFDTLCFFVEDKDEKTLRDAYKLDENTERYVRKSDKKEDIENISRQARSLFDRKIMVEKYLNLYETICENIK